MISCYLLFRKNVYFSFVNIESSTSDDIEDDDYIRDGTDYGNITRIHEDEDTSQGVVETSYVEKTEDVIEELDLNTTIVSGEDVEPSSSIWEGILGLVEDIDKDSKLIDVRKTF